jgi:hypothetical protein
LGGSRLKGFRGFSVVEMTLAPRTFPVFPLVIALGSYILWVAFRRAWTWSTKLFCTRVGQTTSSAHGIDFFPSSYSDTGFLVFGIEIYPHWA